jgi:hypothetical protein
MQVIGHPKQNLVMHSKSPTLLFIAFLLTGQFVMSQAAGDFRTNKATVTWLTPGDWERYNGTSWVTATEYPGQNPGTGTVTLKNNQNVALGSSIPNAIGALTFEPGNNAMNLTFGGAYTLTVTGAVTLNGPNNNGTRYIAVDAGTLNCASLGLGTTDNNSKIAQLRISTGTVTISGNLTLNSPGVRNNITINSTGTLNVAGSFTDGGAAGISFAAGSTVNFNGNGAQTIPAYSYQNLTCSVSGAKTAAGSFSVAGTLNVASGVSLEMEGFDLSGAALTTSGGGNVVTKSTSATPLPSGRTWSMNVYYTFAGNQTVVSGTYNGSFIAGGGGTKSAAGNLTLNGVLSVGSTSTLDMGNSSILLGTPTSIVSPGIIKTAVPTATSNTPFPAGLNWGSVGTVEYAGTVAQTAMAGTYHNLTVSGGGTKSMSGNISVGGTLTFTSGKINGGTNTLTLTSATPTAQVSGGSATSYIYNTGAGRLRRNNLSINDSHTFPVGTSNYYMPVVVTPLEASSDFAVNTFQGLTQDGTPSGTPFANKNPVVDAVWNIDRLAGTGDAGVTINWDAALEGSAFATFPGSQIGISHFTLGNWQLAISAGDGDNSANKVSAIFGSFSPFAVGKTGTVLPITFTNLKAYEKQRGVQVDWKVTADKNVSTYVVERSADGRSFTKIGTVNANQSDLASAYGFYDAAPLPGTGYYRIASQQKDGSNSLSAVLRVNLNKSIKETIIYPNPVKGSMLSLQSTNLEKGNYSIRMYSVNGQELLQLRFDHNGGAINQMINLPKNLQPGMYDIMLDKAGSRVMSKKVMVQ